MSKHQDFAALIAKKADKVRIRRMDVDMVDVIRIYSGDLFIAQLKDDGENLDEIADDLRNAGVDVTIDPE